MYLHPRSPPWPLGSLRRFRIPILYLFLLNSLCTTKAFLHTAASRPGLRQRGSQTQNGVSDSTTFIARAYQASLVLGPHLYVDGGIISLKDNATSEIFTLPDNNTYAITLDKSWKIDNVEFIPIPKAAPVMSNEALWADRVGQVLYAFGGEQTNVLPQDELPAVPAKSLWCFTPDGDTGEWAEVEEQAMQGFDQVVPVSGALWTSGGYGGYLLGGYESAKTSAESGGLDGDVPKSGMTVFNYTTQSWATYSAEGFSGNATAIFGEAHFINGFSESGVVVAFGGEAVVGNVWTDDGSSSLLSFDTVYIWDEIHHNWYSQSTSGTIPTPRYRFCSVSVTDGQGTVEIFIVGGSAGTLTSPTEAQKTQNLAMDEVFVLSLPGFNWQKADYPPSWPRVGHSCNFVGHGQMAVIGGLNPTSGSEAELFATPDPWTKGVGIFHLSTMQWATKYNPRGQSYSSPQVVQDWYAQNGKYPARWDSGALKEYFETGIPLPSTLTSSPSTSSSSTKHSPTSLPPTTLPGGVFSPTSSIVVTTTAGGSVATTRPADAKTSPGSTHTSPGVIAAIAIGTTVLILLLVMLMWLIWRRRRKSKQDGPALASRSGVGGPSLLSSAEGPATAEPTHLGFNPAELGGNTMEHTLPGHREFYNLKPWPTGREKTGELPAEAPTRHSRYEMASPTVQPPCSPLQRQGSEGAPVRYEMPG